MSELELLEAVKAENLEAVTAALDAGADVNQTDEQGWTPLNWAAGQRLLNLVPVLPSQCLFLHPLPKTERPHVRPDLFDVSQTFGLRPALPRVLPAERVLAIRRPDRVLLFVVDDHFVNRRVFSFVHLP